MLPEKNRLKKKRDFERVFKEGSGFKEDFLYLKIIGNGLKSSRFGFAISKKFSKKATTRNQIKRRIRELVKTRLPLMKRSVDGVIVVIPGLEKKDFWELEEVINSLFLRAGLTETKD